MKNFKATKLRVDIYYKYLYDNFYNSSKSYDDIARNKVVYEDIDTRKIYVKRPIRKYADSFQNGIKQEGYIYIELKYVTENYKYGNCNHKNKTINFIPINFQLENPIKFDDCKLKDKAKCRICDEINYTENLKHNICSKCYQNNSKQKLIELIGA